MFKSKTKLVRTVEAKPVSELTPEIRESLAALSYHPAFQYLITKLRFQGAVLEAKLHERQRDIHDVEFLQSGIFWVNWLDNQIRFLTKTPEAPQVEMTPEEERLFQEISSTIETVGS